MRGENHTKKCRDAFTAAGASDLNCNQGKFTLAQLETIAACPDISHQAVRDTIDMQRHFRRVT